MSRTGDIFPLRTAFATEVMKPWYDSIYGDTNATLEFSQRGFAHCCQWASGRMVDDAKAILESYQKNDNAPQGQSTKLPFVAIAMAKDYTPMGADWGGRQLGRKLVAIEPGGSAYGFRMAMHDTRIQIAIFAHDVDSAKSLAAQFCLHVGQFAHRRFKAIHEFGQYQIPMPVVFESPDPSFMAVDTGQKNVTILVADMFLKASIPYFDAPKPGQENDGSTNNPPGYALVERVNLTDLVTGLEAVTTEPGTEFH